MRKVIIRHARLKSQLNNTGALIGAGSVVTKSVPAYAIVCGNPATIIKYRFSEGLIKQLEELDFWSLSDKEIDEFDIFSEDIAGFILSVKKYKES